jgi:hypothetical protein
MASDGHKNFPKSKWTHKQKAYRICKNVRSILYQFQNSSNYILAKVEALAYVARLTFN